MIERPSIAIVGAGPAGLTAANVLDRSGWRFEVFEVEQSIGARDQGGSLDLHPQEGQLALEKAGLLDAFFAVARHEDQEQRVYDYRTAHLIREIIPEPGKGDRPEIDRLLLRTLLLELLPEGSVRWNAPINKVQAQPDGRYMLHSATGVMGPFDLVIGADGAYSKVRAALTDVRPNDTGVAFAELWLSDVDRLHPDHSALVGHGMMISLHDGAGIIAQRNGNETIRVYAAFRTTPGEGGWPTVSLSNVTKDTLRARFAGWAPSLVSLITDADAIVAVRPVVSLPPGLRWPQRDGLTLVGDAAHVMPPLGVGVNLAMLDAAELAEALIGSVDWRQAVREYEKVMLDRAERISVHCNAAFDEMYSEAGAQAVIDNLDGR
ncbi:FAD-dependent oxidoreductase [Trinickia diaoshuihuensis]|uniref:FAD-dependent oxidoreductase n=1 Tax=Trinickia diaoshuihuensis TaxID=2292265 RepID=UPI000E25579D|nr:NAD(P)/FAD-dependent oxidoreductase [Trinickia diaoshuihuensis]